MGKYWKIFVKDRDNLRIVLNSLLMNREAELIISKVEGLSVLVEQGVTTDEIVRFIRDEFGNWVENCSMTFSWRENVFFFSSPKFIFDSPFPFLVETSLVLAEGDRIHVKTERYRTFNPIMSRKLGSKKGKILYRMRLYTPILLRDYSNRDGRQSLTFKGRFPLILTSFELSSMINGSVANGLLAI